MGSNLDSIDTIVIVILENRSFDHALGYLSLPGQVRMPVEGLSDDPNWLSARASVWNGKRFLPFYMTKTAFADPPHDRKTIEMQIGRNSKKGMPPPLDGFVKSYLTRNPKPDDPSVVMGYYTATEVPIFDFFARHFLVCDHWFASLPTGTQPNRLMAMSGVTSIVDNAVPMPDQDLVYDWLTQRDVSWCVYHAGDFFPFFSLMRRWMDDIAASILIRPSGDRGHFRRLINFDVDWRHSPTMPKVIFVEPEYTDAPHTAPNDDHPPTPITEGQRLLRNIYLTLVANPKRWARTMMIVTYDEHGGFFDHVPPLRIPTTVRTMNGWSTLFPTTGIRVPAFVISPFVEPGSVFSGPLDHTSVLQLLAEKFDGSLAYSAAVAERQGQLAQLSAALTRSEPRSEVLTPPPVSKMQRAMSFVSGSASLSIPTENENSKAFKQAAAEMLEKHPKLTRQEPQLAALKAAVETEIA